MIMGSKPLILSSVLLLSSWVFVCNSQGLDNLLQGLAVAASTGSMNSMPCMEKLLPCQTFLKSPNNPPTDACCQPLKEMISNDTKCLCDVLGNPNLLKSMNVTVEDALKLPKACGTNADISTCKNEASAPSTPPSPPSPLRGVLTGDAVTSSPAPASSAAHGISAFGVSGFGAFLVAIAFTAF